MVGAAGAAVTTPVGALPLAPGPAVLAERATVVVLVRPEQLELSADPTGAPLAGEVCGYEYYGHDAVVRVRPDGGQPAELVVRVHGSVSWAVGARVGITAGGPVRAWPGPAAPPPDDHVDVITPMSSSR